MDQDGDETLTADEFVAGCMADEELMAMLQPGLDPKDGWSLLINIKEFMWIFLTDTSILIFEGM